MDDNKIGPPEIVAMASVGVFFFATFLPWFSVSVSGDSSGILSGADFPSANGWDAGFLWSGFPLLLGFALLALLLLPKVAPDISLPDLPPYLPLAIAGAAGPAMEMVKLFQLQLEHYEKVEGTTISLEGKANQLSQMVRGHLPAAMQGFAVVPLFAGYDTARQEGRLFEYDVTGGRYEESEYATTGSGSLHAGAVVKMGYRPDLTREQVIDLVISALFEAADEDSATGGPDLVRAIYPSVATITAGGFEVVEEAEVAQRFRGLVDQLTSSRGPRTDPEVNP